MRELKIKVDEAFIFYDIYYICRNKQYLHIQWALLENLLNKTSPSPFSDLKQQLDGVRQAMGESLNERNATREKGTARVMADHDRLRKDLLKEKEAGESLRLKIRQQEVSNYTLLSPKTIKFLKL